MSSSTSGSKRSGPHDVTDVVHERTAQSGRRLLVMWSSGSILRELPDEGVLDIGRGDDANVRVDHGSISRRHARLIVAPEVVHIEDLGSSNGTWVGVRKLASRARAVLEPEVVVELGNVLLIVRDTKKTAPPARQGPEGDIVVVDPGMERIHQLVELVAKSSLNVLLLGETGVGKEILATRVHELSPRARAPFLKVNCAALVESLLEAELFGYEKGAFTGAVQAKPGLLEGATNGTLFLDEVGELPLTTQAKLLRVLESGEVTRVGGVKPRAVDVRFVAATNRDLKEGTGHGTFRKDLYFRLDGVSIRIPPLRERPTEVAALARAFAAQACAKAGRPRVTLSDAAMASLATHPWPGNARELRNVVARAVLLCPGSVVLPEHLHFGALGADAPPPTSPSSDPPAAAAQTMDKTKILDALDRCAGNQTRAAKMLGVSRSTLVRWLDAIGARRPRK
jgi:transcriptional regulator with PAS, ATPase and Fis domain